jgi:hypothetical protein
MGMYFFDFYLSEALTGASPDYIAVSHAGHGVNSYALNYQIVDGPLILFAQAPWGGVYNDRGKDELRVAALFERIATLINVSDRAKAMERVGQPGWLCVFESHLRELFAWGWLPHKLDGKDAARAWISARQLPRRPVEPLSLDKLPTAAARQFLEEGGPALPLESN